MNTKLANIVFNEIGVYEIVGDIDNPEVLKYFNGLGFNGKALKDETAWCAAFANWALKEADLPYQKKLNARSFLEIGEDTVCPQLLDLVVLYRGKRNGWKGHVGFYIKETEKYIYILGGNQNNKVCIKPYAKSRLLGYRSFN